MLLGSKLATPRGLFSGERSLPIGLLVVFLPLDDAMGDMPTPERLVPPDMPLPKPNGGEKLDIDNKVANFLAVSIFYHNISVHFLYIEEP